MPEVTSAGGGFTCQVCGTTYQSENELIRHGRDQHPDKPVTWGDPSATTPATVRAGASEVKRNAQEGMEEMTEKIKAGAKAAGEKIAHPEKDLQAEYEQKKAEEKAK